MKRLVKTSAVALLIASLMAVFAGTALAAPAGPQSSAVMDAVQLAKSPSIPIFQIIPELAIECIACPELAQSPEDGGSVPPAEEIGDDGPVLEEVPATPQTPEEPETPNKPDEPEIPETPATPETPEEPETPEAETEEPKTEVSSSKLPNTGTKLMLIALGAVAMVGGAPLVGMWADNRLNRK